ncbi:MAG TPA: hypothetical protein VFC94_06770 [Bacteroidaceae bacterium]|nr:hypothetical protein [Bacteroidaceae bacterium]
MKETFLLIFFCAFFIGVQAQISDISLPTSDNEYIDISTDIPPQSISSSKKKSRKSEKVELRTVHMFATSFSFTDSILFITDIQTVENVEFVNRFFLLDITQFGVQFKDYLKEAGESSPQVSSLFFSTKLRKVTKQYNSIHKKTEKKKQFIPYKIGNEFKFNNPGN